MKFTYDAYQKLIQRLKDKEYRIADYKSWQEKERCVILRHDVDTDISKAVKLASIEEMLGVTSTYFVLLTSDFYNVFSKKSRDEIKQVMDSGHTIGLHFDEVCYPRLSGNVEAIKEKIMEEVELLSSAIENKVDIVSMHRPSQFVLEADLDIPGIINSYGQTYFKKFKYLSDSRRRWREPVDAIIDSGRYERLHILTHPFWYSEAEEDIHQTVSQFVNGGNDFRYQVMASNITDISSIMTVQEVMKEKKQYMKAAEILNWLTKQGYEYKFTGDSRTEIESFSALENYKDKSLTWIKKEENYDAFKQAQPYILCRIQSGINVDFENAIITDNSKEVFFAILHEFWGEEKKEGTIGEGTIISDKVVIDPTVTIGCNCSIVGDIVIGAHTVIENNIVIQGNVSIGKDCIIHSGTVIGVDGSGMIWKAEHFGGVEIGNAVEIGANTCIDRGTIDNTIIGDHSKIDNLVHIAHNAHIGKSVCIVAGAVLCGSVKVKDGAYVAPGGIVKNQIEIGSNGFVGLGAVVTRAVENNEVVIGVPAKPIRKFRKGDK